MAAIALAVIGVASPVCLFRPAWGAAQSPNLETRVALFASYVEALRIQAVIPGLSTAIVSNGGIVWENGSGFADVEARTPARPDTPYAVASITKTFSSTLLMQCVDAGTLDLDTAMRAYTTSVPDTTATVRHVLSMTSDAPAGSRYRYDGDRFSALTTVIQACTGSALRLALAARVLDRLAMGDSVPGHDLDSNTADAALFDAVSLDRYRRVLSRMAKPYSARGGRPMLAEYPPRGINAAAGLVSTVRDLARYDAALDAHLLMSTAAQSLAWTPFVLPDRRTSPYALGWFTQSTAAGQAIWHYGSWPTFSSLFLKLPDRQVTLILLANSDGLSARFPLAAGDVEASPFARAFIAAMR